MSTVDDRIEPPEAPLSGEGWSAADDPGCHRAAELPVPSRVAPLPAPTWWAWLLPVVVAILAGLPTLIYPFGRDQGNYAYAGWVVLEGGAPYADVFVFKPPMTVLVHSLSMALFGVDMLSIRIVDLGWAAATAGVIALVAQRLVGRNDVALWAGVAGSLLYWPIDYWNIAQTDGWLNLPCAGALLAVLVAGDALDRGWRGAALGAWLLAGVLAAVAVLFKYTAATVALPLLLGVLHVGLRHGWRVWPALVLIPIGALIPLAGTWAWLVGVGAWDAFLDVQLELVPEYVARTRKNRTVWESLERLFALTHHKADVAPLFYAGLVALLPAVGTAVWGGRRSLLGWGIALAWWGTALASVLGQGKFFDYHYLPFLVPSALFVGLFVGGVLGWIAAWLPAWARWVGGSAVVVGTIAITPLGGHWMDLVAVAGGSRSIESYWATERQYQYRDYDIDEQRRLVEVLVDTTDPADRVFVWGFDPAINVWARRRTVSRFLYNYPFRVSWGNPAYEEELMASLNADPPEVFVVASRDRTPGVTGSRKDSRQLFVEFGALRDFVAARYSADGRVGRYAVYRLDPAVTEPGAE